MKKTLYSISVIAAALLAAASCQSRITPDEELGDGILCFQPTLDGVRHAELDSASDGIAGQARNDANAARNDANAARNDANGARNRHAGPDPASPQTKAADLVSTDGSIVLALGYEVCDGISVMPDSDSASLEIAGQARNDANVARNDANDARDRHAELDSASPLTKGTLLNTTNGWADLGSYVNKFYVAAWKGSASFVPANTAVSKATPLWQTATTYSWGATESATFYAYANLPASGATVSAASSAQTLTYSAVPTASSAQTDILMGYYSGTPKYDATLHKGGIAEIKFYHPMTAVRFKKGTFDATSVQFKSISIKGVYASGTATMSPTTMAKTNTYEKVSWNTSSSTTQTVTMTPASGTELTVDADNFIGDAFLLIPQTMTSTSSVKITVKAVLNGSTEEKELVAKLANNEWKAGQTNVYTLAFDDPNN